MIPCCVLSGHKYLSAEGKVDLALLHAAIAEHELARLGPLATKRQRCAATDENHISSIVEAMIVNGVCDCDCHHPNKNVIH